MRGVWCCGTRVVEKIREAMLKDSPYIHYNQNCKKDTFSKPDRT